MININLFCFPYAGASALIYEKWGKYLNNNITLIPIELRGRGKRIHEPFYKSIEELIDDVYILVNSKMDNNPYCFFGHSLGSCIAYELAKKIIKKDKKKPLHIFFSGYKAPVHTSKKRIKNYNDMPIEEFKEEIKDLGGTPDEFFMHPDLMNLFIPILKNDLVIIENFEHDNDHFKFDFDISVLFGKKEKYTFKEMIGWKDFTDKLCAIYYFEGEHFFINNEYMKIINIINNTLSSNNNKNALS